MKKLTQFLLANTLLFATTLCLAASLSTTKEIPIFVVNNAKDITAHISASNWATTPLELIHKDIEPNTKALAAAPEVSGEYNVSINIQLGDSPLKTRYNTAVATISGSLSLADLYTIRNIAPPILVVNNKQYYLSITAGTSILGGGDTIVTITPYA